MTSGTHSVAVHVQSETRQVRAVWQPEKTGSNCSWQMSVCLQFDPFRTSEIMMQGSATVEQSVYRITLVSGKLREGKSALSEQTICAIDRV